MKRIAVVLTALILGVAFSPAAPAGAYVELWELAPNPAPTPTPIVNLDNPPPSVASADAVATCANDDFLAQRAVPSPWEREVTVCGTVIAVPAGATRGGPGAQFALDVDGTRPIPVIGNVTAKVGDTAVVRGRYRRDKSGADWIDRVTQTLARDWSHPGYVILNGTTYQ